MKLSRNRREMMTLVAGMLIGIVLGAAMMGTSPDLREAIFGTSASVDGNDGAGVPGDVEFYLADLESTQAWLAAQLPTESEQIQAALETLMALPSSPFFRQDFQAASDDLDLVLPRLYRQLSAPLGPTDQSDPSKLIACLGMEDNPYNPAPTLLFYLTVPKQKTTTLVLPTQWEKLAEPLSNTLFWQLLACYPQPQDAAS